jgi:hypothetical protein
MNESIIKEWNRMKVQVIDKNMRYWVVRPGENGTYFKHFRTHNVVALGHIDHIVKEEGIIERVKVEELKKAFLDFNNDKRKKEKELNEEKNEAEKKAEKEYDSKLEAAQISSASGQVATFINDVKKGDLIITLDSDSLLIGRVTSDAYVEKEELKVLRKDGQGVLKTTLKYALRRNVKWNEFKSRHHIPSPIKPCFSPSQTIFSISEKRIEIFTHWLYSVYITDEKLFFSTKINEPKSISQFNLTEFQRAIQKLELISERVINNDIEIYDNLSLDIDIQYLLTGVRNEFTLTAKNSFMSEGNIWSAVSGDPKKLYVFALMLGLLFNTSVHGEEDIDLTENQLAFIDHTVKNLKDEGNFDLFKAGIQASLDSQNVIIKDEEYTEPKNTTKLVFPKNNEEGHTGI